jgi:hypothetical protein
MHSADARVEVSSFLDRLLQFGYFLSSRPSSALPRQLEKAATFTRASSESQKATLLVRLSGDFRLSVPPTTGSVRREDFSLYAGSFAAGFTVLFPFCLIKSRGGEDTVAHTGKPYLNRQEEMRWSSRRRVTWRAHTHRSSNLGARTK